MKRNAFTLVELLVVVAVIGILFVVLLSKVDFATNKAKTAGVQTDFQSFRLAFEAVAKENAGFNTIGWDIGDINGDGIRNSYDTGDLNHNGHCDKAGENGAVEDEIFTGRKVYAETWTGIYTLKNPANPNDASAIRALETAINKNLDPKLHITIADDYTITMANQARDPWGNEYFGSYITCANIDKLDKGAVIICSAGANGKVGSFHSVLEGKVTVHIPGKNIDGMDDYSISTIFSLANGFGKVVSQTSGFSLNQDGGASVSYSEITAATENLQNPDFVVRTADELSAAIANGGVIRLANDITLDHGDSTSSALVVQNGKVVTLDLNGKTLSSGENFAGAALFENKYGAKLTITGNGTVELDPKPGKAGVMFAPRGTLIIRNGTFIMPYIRGNDKSPEGNTAIPSLFAGINVKDPENKSASVEIYGGYFDGGYWRTDEFVSYNTSGAAGPNSLVSLSWNESFLIYGGTFVGYNPAWGDEACSAYYTANDEKTPTKSPSPKQGLFLKGQTFDGEELPEGYTILEGLTMDGTVRPIYTVIFSDPED